MYTVRFDGVSYFDGHKFDTVQDALTAVIVSLDCEWRSPEVYGTPKLKSTWPGGQTYSVWGCCDEDDDPEGYGWMEEHEIEVLEI